MKWLTKTIKFILIGMVIFFFLFPVYWLVTTAFKRSEDWFTWPPSFFPQHWTLGNFLGLEGGFLVVLPLLSLLLLLILSIASL